jgi:hypothetical protein
MRERPPRVSSAPAGLMALSFLGASLLWASPSRGTEGDLQRFEGGFRYADGQQGLRRIDAGIDDAVRGMPFFVAPIARDIVRGRVAHHRELFVAVEGSRVRFRTESWGPVSSRLNGPAVPIVAPEGTPLELRQRFDGSRLVQVFQHPEGVRENTLALSGDGEWLWISVRIASPRLPHDCRYRLRYRRVTNRFR